MAKRALSVRPRSSPVPAVGGLDFGRGEDERRGTSMLEVVHHQHVDGLRGRHRREELTGTRPARVTARELRAL